MACELWSSLSIPRGVGSGFEGFVKSVGMHARISDMPCMSISNICKEGVITVHTSIIKCTSSRMLQAYPVGGNYVGQSSEDGNNNLAIGRTGWGGKRAKLQDLKHLSNNTHDSSF